MDTPCVSSPAWAADAGICGLLRHLTTVKSQTSKALAKLRTVAPELAELYLMEGSAR